MSCNFNVSHFPTLTEIRCAVPKAKLSVLTQRFEDCTMDADEVEESLQLELIEMQCSVSRTQKAMCASSEWEAFSARWFSFDRRVERRSGRICCL